ncbi:MAG TPA: hypothetical protein VIJ77_00760 [Candidatus Tumulicola sp.]
MPSAYSGSDNGRRDSKNSALDSILAQVEGGIGRLGAALIVGRVAGELVTRFDAAGWKTKVVVLSDEAAAQARTFCPAVAVLDPNACVLPGSLKEARFDVAIFEGAIEYLREPEQILAAVRDLLTERGAVIAVVPHSAHGAIRLALMNGESDEIGPGAGTVQDVETLFERSGYCLESIDRIILPMFGENPGFPKVHRSDFSEAVIRIVEADPESETAQFVVKAVPAGTASDTLQKPRLSRSPDDLSAEIQLHETSGMGDEKQVTQFQDEFELQCRVTQLDHELSMVLKDLDRERGRVIALESQLREEVRELTARLAEAARESAKLRSGGARPKPPRVK